MTFPTFWILEDMLSHSLTLSRFIQILMETKEIMKYSYENSRDFSFFNFLLTFLCLCFGKQQKKIRKIEWISGISHPLVTMAIMGNM